MCNTEIIIPFLIKQNCFYLGYTWINRIKNDLKMTNPDFDFRMDLGLILMFYALYYGVMARDIAEICTEKMVSQIGVSSIFLNKKRPGSKDLKPKDQKTKS